ncbi:MAG: DUF1194 domain-containing protein [Geminicoccaceae bacterium]
MRFLRHLLPAALALLPAAAAAEQPVDVELVLAVDVSGSVDADEQALERDGLVRAFHDRAVIEAIGALPQGLAVAVVAFAGAGQTQTVVSWHRLADPRQIAAFADRIARAFPVRFAYAKCTAIGDAIEWSRRELVGNGYRGRARIDVSGDGRSSDGEYPGPARDRAVAGGIVISGLAILNEESYLDEYYRRTVVGGPGAFVLTAADYASFAEALRRKLLQELSSGPTASRRPI